MPSSIPFYVYPPEIRRILHTTNAIESMHMQVRKVLRNRGHFPSDEAASKLIYLALQYITKNWKMPLLTWKAAVNQFAIIMASDFALQLAEGQHVTKPKSDSHTYRRILPRQKIHLLSPKMFPLSRKMFCRSMKMHLLSRIMACLKGQKHAPSRRRSCVLMVYV